MKLKIIFIIFTFATSGCFSTGQKTTLHNRCPGVFQWPKWQKLFADFAAKPQSMHNFLHNGNDLWPKTANLCALGRNAFLDLALGPGTSLEYGLSGSAWMSLIRSVAFTNSFSRGTYDKNGTRWLYIWPVITTSHTQWILELAYRQMNPALPLRDELKLPSGLSWQAQYTWSKTDLQNKQKTWETRLLYALVLRISLIINKWGNNPPTYEPAVILKNIRRLEGRKQFKFIYNFVRYAYFKAAKEGNLHPSEYLQSELVKLTGTSVKGYKRPLSPMELSALCKSNSRLEKKYAERLKELDYITSTEEKTDIPAGIATKRKDYQLLKKLGLYWNKKLLQISSSPDIQKEVMKALLSRKITVTGNFFNATTHLEESSSGFTHAGLVVNLPGHAKPWLLERVLGFYYVNQVHTLKNSSVVEVLSVPRTDMKNHHYSIVPFTVKTPFRFKKGVSDIVTFKNIYYSFKKQLDPRYRLGPGFIFGAMHIIPNLLRNREIFRSIYGIESHGKYTFLDIKKGHLLKNREIFLIARCVN
ncbi:hypothetical protein KKF34_05130 [Myxococcota bacterium]|nr:hypothetical protein [Myxococcota bacterium]MBU1380913.1 hypothetical protein [Myxococcota bacterium]MBU1496244.1 hypothetical protein [Myxococcota bacterium]